MLDGFRGGAAGFFCEKMDFQALRVVIFEMCVRVCVCFLNQHKAASAPLTARDGSFI